MTPDEARRVDREAASVLGSAEAPPARTERMAARVSAMHAELASIQDMVRSLQSDLAAARARHGLLLDQHRALIRWSQDLAAQAAIDRAALNLRKAREAERWQNRLRRALGGAR